ncbi:MAG: ParA family protein [Campylobacterales bacterium]
MKTVVVSNRKGGSAKSTTAVNVAAAMAQQGKKVLLLDFDTQGHASIGVGARPVREGGFHSIFSGNALSFTFVPTAVKNLTLSPANDLFDPLSEPIGEFVLRERLTAEGVGEFFDLCIIDTPPTYDALLKNALAVADAVIIPVLPHFLGEVGVRQMVRALFQTGATLGHSIGLVRVLPVMYNAHLPSHRQSVANLRQLFGEEKFLPPIRLDIKAAEAFEARLPLSLYDPKGRAARDYMEVAQMLSKLLYSS